MGWGWDVHPHRTESFWALQGSPVQVRAQGRSPGQVVTPGLCLPRGDSGGRRNTIRAKDPALIPACSVCIPTLPNLEGQNS